MSRRSVLRGGVGRFTRVAVVATAGVLMLVSCGSNQQPSAGSSGPAPSSAVPSSAAPSSPAPSITLELATAATKSIGSAGGTITATSTAGVTFDFVVPALALESDVQITVTPIVSQQGLPFSDGLLAGVELKPTGISLSRPLTLRIASPRSVPVGEALIGFTASGPGDVVTLLPASLKDGVISILVPHFSIVGAALVLPSELAALAPPVDVQSRVNDFASVALTIAQSSDLTSALTQLEVVFSRWYARLLPILNGGLFGDTELLGALEEYRFWLDAMAWAGGQLGNGGSLVLIPGLARLNEQARSILYLDLVEGIARANQACLSFRDLNKAEIALFWQATAENLGLASLTTPLTLLLELSRPVVLANLCVQVFVSESSFPAEPDPNESSDLKLRFGIQFGSEPQLRDSTFAVSLMFVGTAADGPADVTTDFSGKLDFSVVATGQQTLQITVKACMLPADVGADDVCVSFTIERAVPIVFTFDTDLDGWAAGVAGPKGANNWGTVYELDRSGGVVQLDGTGNPGQPNAWIFKTITLPPDAGTLSFDVSAHDRDLSDSHFTVRLVDGATNNSLADDIVTGVEGALTFGTRTVDISAWAGRTVTLFFEQDDNGLLEEDDSGFHRVFPGANEQILLDNIRIVRT